MPTESTFLLAGLFLLLAAAGWAMGRFGERDDDDVGVDLFGAGPPRLEGPRGRVSRASGTRIGGGGRGSDAPGEGRPEPRTGVFGKRMRNEDFRGTGRLIQVSLRQPRTTDI